MAKIKQLAARQDAEARYAVIRALAFRQTEQVLQQELDLSVHLQTIDETALQAAEKWPFQVEPRRVTRWDWRKILKSFRRRARRLEVAFYLVEADDSLTLWGLLVGRFSRSRLVASMHYLARGPAESVAPFAVAAVRYLQLHAVALGCPTIAVNKPLPELVEYYQELGFSRVIGKQGRVDRLESSLDSMAPFVAGKANEEQR